MSLCGTPIYVKLIQYFDSIIKSRSDSSTVQRHALTSLDRQRPVNLFNQWQELTGQVLLERYGMTEIGMGISNLMRRRRAGCVGQPLPCTGQLFDENDSRYSRGNAG